MVPYLSRSQSEVAHHLFFVVPKGLTNLQVETGGLLIQLLLAALTGVSLLLWSEAREGRGNFQNRTRARRNS